jgi:hypothetical protein
MSSRDASTSAPPISTAALAKISRDAFWIGTISPLLPLIVRLRAWMVAIFCRIRQSTGCTRCRRPSGPLLRVLWELLRFGLFQGLDAPGSGREARYLVPLPALRCKVRDSQGARHGRLRAESKIKSRMNRVGHSDVAGARARVIRASKKKPCQWRTPGRENVSTGQGYRRAPNQFGATLGAPILGEREWGHNDQTVLTPVARSSDVALRIAKAP